MGIMIDGIKGEQQLFGLLRNNGFAIFQPDAIGLKDEDYYVFECKHQERFNAPPFDGHGLPRWQVEARLNFQKRTGIKSILVVFEKPYDETKTLYYQSLERLENSEHFDTRGGKPRRIYNLNAFKKVIN